MRATAKFKKSLAATALTVAMVGGSVGVADAAPKGSGGPSAEQEHACLAAYHIMEWAKAKRKKPDDVYDRIANAAADYVNDNCDGVDIPQGSLGPSSVTPQPKVTVDTDIVVTTGSLSNADDFVLTIEPMDNPIGF